MGVPPVTQKTPDQTGLDAPPQVLIDPPLQAFQKQLEAQGLASNTIKTYLLYAKIFIEGGEPTPDWVQQFVTKYNHRPCRSCLKQYQDCFDLNFKIPPLKGRRKRPPIKYLTKEEIDQLILGAPNNRTALLVNLLFITGLRISEALQLTPKNIDITVGVIRGIGKGNAPFKVPVNDVWLDYWADCSSDDVEKDEPLFPFGRRRAHTIISDLGLKVLGRRIHPHQIRHSIGMHLKRKGMPIEDIKEYLRHKDIGTTMIYAHTENKEEVLKKGLQLTDED